MGREEGEYGSAKNQNTVCYQTKNDVAEMRRSNKFKKVIIGKYNMDYFQGRHFNEGRFWPSEYFKILKYQYETYKKLT